MREALTRWADYVEALVSEALPLIKRRMISAGYQGLFRQMCRLPCIETTIGFSLLE